MSLSSYSTEEGILGLLAFEIDNLTNHNRPNPFRNLAIFRTQSFLQRLRTTLGVFGGKNNIYDKDGDPKRWWYLPRQTKYGIFNYLVGLPIRLLSSVIALLGLLIVGAGIGCLYLTQLIFEKFTLIPILLFAIPVLGVGLLVTGGLVYGVSKVLFYPIDLLAHKVIIPALSYLSTLAVSPFVAIAHLASRIKNWGKAKSKLVKINGDTGGTTGELLTGLNKAQQLSPTILDNKPDSKKRKCKSKTRSGANDTVGNNCFETSSQTASPSTSSGVIIVTEVKIREITSVFNSLFLGLLQVKISELKLKTFSNGHLNNFSEAQRHSPMGHGKTPFFAENHIPEDIDRMARELNPKVIEELYRVVNKTKDEMQFLNVFLNQADASEKLVTLAKNVLKRAVPSADRYTIDSTANRFAEIITSKKGMTNEQCSEAALASLRKVYRG